MTLLVTAAQVRTYLDNVSVSTSDQYSDETIGSNVLAAQSSLEQALGRYLVPRTFTTVSPWYGTSSNRQQMPLPGFRTVTSLTKSGAALTANAGYWLVPDIQQTGVYTGVAFRAATGPEFWPGQPGTPYGPWITNPAWFDLAADSPFYPANVGGAIYLTSLPNDIVIEGTAGYDPTLADGTQGFPPYAVLHAIKILAAFYTMRPASILADVAITPQGGVLNYSQMPAEVRDFIASWKGGTNMMVPVG